ncbi:hypothetical protein VTN00DRAFT_6092 [Thermoascus crustaceus]|uniref:uncharacterized protein n=1 Tax=Thermoascus crustaceus TaxID=5088 RepID=UPI003743EF4B
MKIPTLIPLSVYALLLSVSKVYSAQIGVLAFGADDMGGHTETYGVRVVCDNNADFFNVEADGGCELPVQTPGSSCTVNACGGSYTGTWTEVNSQGCNNAISISAGNVNGEPYPGGPGCRNAQSCTEGGLAERAGSSFG